MSTLNEKMTLLADAVRSKAGISETLSIDKMISAINSINTQIATGDSEVQFGYWTSDGKFQEIDLSGDSPANTGNAVEADAVIFRTGLTLPNYDKNSTEIPPIVDTPDDSSSSAEDSTVNTISLYECASYTQQEPPDTDIWSGYMMERIPDTCIEVTGYTDEHVEGNGLYILGHNDSDYALFIKPSVYPDGLTNAISVYAMGDVMMVTAPMGPSRFEYYLNLDTNISLLDNLKNITCNDPHPSDGPTLKIALKYGPFWHRTDILKEGMPVLGMVPVEGEIYSEDTTIMVCERSDDQHE